MELILTRFLQKQRTSSDATLAPAKLMVACVLTLASHLSQRATLSLGLGGWGPQVFFNNSCPSSSPGGRTKLVLARSWHPSSPWRREPTDRPTVLSGTDSGGTNWFTGSAQGHFHRRRREQQRQRQQVRDGLKLTEMLTDAPEPG